MQTSGQMLIHNVTLAEDAQDTIWPSVWGRGEIGREQRRPDAPQEVMVLISNASGNLSLRLQATKNTNTPAVIVTPGADGSPQWMHARVGDPMVLVNDQITGTNTVVVLFQY